MGTFSPKAAPSGMQQLLCGTAIGLVLTGFGVPAHAQGSTEESANAPTRLGVISVEGDEPGYKAEPQSPKYTAPLVDTPRSVTIVTEEVLNDTGATTLVDALRTVPGIAMAMGEGGQPFADRPFIRGFESTSGILVDGMRDSSAQSRDIFNTEQIEVSKGSSGSFAGRGAPGGSINLVTKTPKSENFSTAMALYGNEDQMRATVDVNRTINESSAARLNLMWQDSGIPGRDELYDKRWGVAPSLAFGLGGPTRVKASYVHYESDGIIDYGHPQDPATGKPIAGIDPDNFYGLINRDFHDTKLDSGVIEFARDITEDITVRNITRYSKNKTAYIASNPDDSQGNIVNGLVIRNVKSSNSENKTFVNQTDLTAQLKSGGVEHSISMGVEFSNEQTNRATYAVEQLAPGGVSIPRGGCDLFGAGAPSGYNCTDLYNPNPLDPWTGAITLRTPTKTEVDTLGAYFFDTLTLTEKLLVNFGIRWDDFSTKTSSGLSNDADFVTTQVGVVFKPSESGSIYASMGSSASPSGVTAGDGGENISTRNEDLKPERGRNYEIGTKWNLYDDRLALSASVFRTEVVDGHITVEPGRGGAQDAIGERRVQGLEVSLAGNIVPEWSIFAGYSYLNSEIIDAGPVGAATEGNQLPNTPEHSLSLWTTYDVTPLARFGGGAIYVSERFGNTANTRSVDGYWRFDAMASYDISEGVGVQVNVTNIADERYYDRVYTTHMATIAPGRSITGSLWLKF